MSTDHYHDANRIRWEAAAPAWSSSAESRGLWAEAYRNAETVLLPEELQLLGDVRGKKLAVLGSGDNQNVFAFAGMGAHVTSVDVSANQLEFARVRAEQLGAQVHFVRADVTDLSALASGSFDVVYTGGHVAVWVADLRRFYSEATRILRTGGLFLINEYHPFRRIWTDAALRARVSYADRGPHILHDPDDLLSGTYEFHWTVSDYLTAVLEPGNTIVAVRECGDGVEDWERPGLAGLPQHLLVAARK